MVGGILSAGWLKVNADTEVSSALDNTCFVLSDNPWVPSVNIYVKSIQSEQIIAYSVYKWALSQLWVNPKGHKNAHSLPPMYPQ